jgi:hypothetical protein
MFLTCPYLYVSYESKSKAIISLNSIKGLIFTMETLRVPCDVKSEFCIRVKRGRIAQSV